METTIGGCYRQRLISFNFLASLINGNNFNTVIVRGLAETPDDLTFNFLASLINGNPGGGDTSSQEPSFNFLASLINGNDAILK